MVQQKALFGLERALFLSKMRRRTFFHYLGKTFRGELPASEFVPLIKRLIAFNKGLKKNKIWRFKGATRLGLTVPNFPNKPFFRASESRSLLADRVQRIMAIVSITDECGCSCDYCYQKQDSGEILSIDTLLQTIRELQDDNVSMFILEGGDPFIRYDRLKAVCETIDDRSEILINTTGDGVTKERLLELKARGLTAMRLSVHHITEEGHDAFLKKPGAWKQMLRVVEWCNEVDIPMCINTVMTPESYDNGYFETMIELANSWNAAFVYCLTPRSAGGNLGKDSTTYSRKRLDELEALFAKYNCSKEYRDYPAISCDDQVERRVFGCTAGGAGRIYINAQGEVQPCPYVNVTFGNVQDRPYPEIITETEQFFKVPTKATACTVMQKPIADAHAESGRIPVPFPLVQEKWLHFQKCDPKRHD